MLNEDFSLKSKYDDIARWYVTKFVEYVSQSLPHGSCILDAGAGEGVYKRFFNHCEYSAIDLAVGESRWNYSNLDYIGPLDNMPIEDEKFDAILCTQVLEHLEWPRESLKEMYRVLKKGGKLYITVPMAQDEHQVPYDFFRYTSYGLKSICSHAGFQNIKVYPLGGRWVRWAYELPRSLLIFPSLRSEKNNLSIKGLLILPIKIILKFIIFFLQRFFFWIDKLDLKKNDPLGWSCEAIK
jgi:ubiquinone/menaquinone biosynthesis C-methylase UbiE